MPVSSSAIADPLRGWQTADSSASRCADVMTMNVSCARWVRLWRASAMFRDLINTLQQIEPVDADWIRRAETRQASLTKPPGSLGRLEELANRVVAIQQSMN